MRREILKHSDLIRWDGKGRKASNMKARETEWGNEETRARYSIKHPFPLISSISKIKSDRVSRD